jgi:hypothetical protein
MRLVHYSAQPISCVRSVEQSSKLDMKPRGLWVSDDACEDNWRTWCETENFSLGNLVYAHDVMLAESANILRLSGALDIDAFHDEWSRIAFSDYRTIDWSAVARKYDGIIISPYIWNRRLDGRVHWYYGWDCASGCIWNAHAIASITSRAHPPSANRLANLQPRAQDT